MKRTLALWWWWCSIMVASRITKLFVSTHFEVICVRYAIHHQWKLKNGKRLDIIAPACCKNALGRVDKQKTRHKEENTKIIKPICQTRCGTWTKSYALLSCSIHITILSRLCKSGGFFIFYAHNAAPRLIFFALRQPFEPFSLMCQCRSSKNRDFFSPACHRSNRSSFCRSVVCRCCWLNCKQICDKC